MKTKMALKINEFYVENYGVSKRRFAEIEKIVRKFLLAECDEVSFDQIVTKIQLVPPKTFDNETDPKFQASLTQLKGSFVKKTTTHEKFFFLHQAHPHYFYKLTAKMKKLLNKTTLFFFNMAGGTFYAFERPKFYRNGRKVADTFSDENSIMLYLASNEVRKLEKLGLKRSELKTLQR